MAGPIQIQPRGLLGFFNLKNEGSNPRDLVETVQPVLDIFSLYKENQAEVILPNGALALATGTDGPQLFAPNHLIVPSNELWWVIHYGIQTGNMPATDDAVYQPMMQLNQAGTIQYELCPNIAPARESTRVATPGKQRYESCGGFFAPSNAELGFWSIQVVAAVTVAFTAYLRVARFRV